MASFVSALKDRIVGSVEENVGYLTGNTEMETHGRELKENATSSRNSESSLVQSPDSSLEQPSSPTSFNPSLFSRNQPDPENSAHGAFKDKMHSETIRQSSTDPMETPIIAPIQSSSETFAGKDVQPLPERKEDTSSTWVEKLGAIMGGTKDESMMNKDVKETDSQESVMDRLRNAHMEATADSQESVMDSLRNAHMEATNQNQDKRITETIKDKFDNWNKSANSVFSGKEPERGLTDTVQERVGEMKDQVTEKVGDMKDQVESYMSKDSSTPADPLLLKQPPVVAPADVPDTNFLQNA
jgi:uncharacterized protein YjbJ (UPF0337 family)